MTEAATAPVETGQVDTPVEAGQANDVATEAAPWYDSAPDDVKGYIQNKGWDDPIKAVNSYQQLEKFQGADPDRLVKLPKDGEPWDEVYNKLGRPETADKYEWSAPEGIDADSVRFESYKSVAHKAGISQAQFEALANADAEYWNNAMQEQQQQIEKQQTVELEALKKDWGSAFNERVELGRRFVSKHLPADIDKGEVLNKIESAIGVAAMLKLFANVGSESKEDRLPDADGGRPFGYSKEQAIADKNELMSVLGADPKRLADYNKGIGPDINKMKTLNNIIAS